jgi:hypothetical protein
VWIALAVALVACRTPATSVLVEYETNVPFERIVDFRAQVQRGEATIDTLAGVVARLIDPASQRLQPAGSFAIRPASSATNDERVTAAIELTGTSGLRLRRLLRVQMIRGVSQRVRVYLSLDCAALSSGCTRVGSPQCTIAARCEELGLTCGDQGQCVAPDLIAQQEGDATVLRPDPDATSVALDVQRATQDATDETASDVAEDMAGDDRPTPPIDSAMDVGCLANTQIDPNNCGRCGVVCASNPMATPSCSSGLCGNRCNAGFGDCDGNVANGCESNLTNSAAHCGACGTGCVAGLCVAGACEQWARNTDSDTAIIGYRIGVIQSELYVYGSYSGAPNLGTGPLAMSNRRGFLAKFSRTGIPVWVRTFGSASLDTVTRKMFAASGAAGEAHVVVGVSLANAATVGGVMFNAGDTVLIDYDGNGRIRWVKHIPPVQADVLVERGLNGDIYVLRMRSALERPEVIDGVMLSGRGIQVLRLDRSTGQAVAGIVIAPSVGAEVTPSAMVINSAGDVIIAGNTLGLVDFGDGMMRGNAMAMSEIFVLALQPNLSGLRWARVATNRMGTLSPPSLAIDDMDSFTMLTTVTGEFSLSPATIGAGVGGSDLALIGFVLSTGTNNINQMVGSMGDDDGRYVQHDDRRGVYFWGQLFRTTMHGPVTLTQDGSVHDYIVRFPSMGGPATSGQVYRASGLLLTNDWVIDPASNSAAFMGNINATRGSFGSAQLVSGFRDNLWLARVAFP